MSQSTREVPAYDQKQAAQCTGFQLGIEYDRNRHLMMVRYIGKHPHASQHQRNRALKALAWLEAHPGLCLYPSRFEEFSDDEATLLKVDAGIFSQDPEDRRRYAGQGPGERERRKGLFGSNPLKPRLFKPRAPQPEWLKDKAKLPMKPPGK